MVFLFMIVSGALDLICQISVICKKQKSGRILIKTSYIVYPLRELYIPEDTVRISILRCTDLSDRLIVCLDHLFRMQMYRLSIAGNN